MGLTGRFEPNTWYGEVTVVRVTEKALLADHEGEEEWIPRSIIHDDSEVWGKKHEGETGTLAMLQWKADELGWE